MAINDIKNLEEYKNYIRQKLEVLRPVFARAAIGDFAGDVPVLDDEDELAELCVGIQTMLEVIRDKVASLEMEIGYRHETEQRLIAKNKDQALAQKAMLNVLDDLQKAKSNTEQEEAKYEALLSSIGDGVLATDSDGFVIFINNSAGEIMGWSSQDLIGKKMTEAIPVEDKDGNVIPIKSRLISQAISGKTVTVTDNYYYVRKDKTRFPVAVNVSPIILGNKIIGTVSTFRDITKEKELDRAKSEFISIASHQLRTPVSALNWITEMLRASLKDLDPKQREYFDDFTISVNRLVRIVEDLLNVSRIEMGTLKIDMKDIKMEDFIKDFTKSIKPYADLKKHTIEFKNKSPSPLVVKIDPKVLNDILQNLVTNAIDYSPSEKSVSISLEKDGDNIRVSVSNKGPAISEEEKKHLFEKFYRSESGKKVKPEGTGLGLYIIKSLVKNSGGEVGFISEKGRDTVFWFSLPLKM